MSKAFAVVALFLTTMRQEGLLDRSVGDVGESGLASGLGHGQLGNSKLTTTVS